MKGEVWMSDCKLVECDRWIPIVLERLQKGQKIKLAPSGMSMYPLLRSGRDQVILKRIQSELKMGDICLYRRRDGTYILHRIHHIEEKGIYMVGDSQTWVEGPLKSSQLLAVAEVVVRNGKEISCQNRLYRLLSWVWLKMRRYRKIIFWLFRKSNLVIEEVHERNRK